MGAPKHGCTKGLHGCSQAGLYQGAAWVLPSMAVPRGYMGAPKHGCTKGLHRVLPSRAVPRGCMGAPKHGCTKGLHRVLPSMAHVRNPVWCLRDNMQSNDILTSIYGIPIRESSRLHSSFCCLVTFIYTHSKEGSVHFLILRCTKCQIRTSLF